MAREVRPAWLAREGGWLLALLIAVVLVVAVVPAARLVLAALVPRGVWRPEAALAVIGGPAALQATWNTLEVGVLSALGALVLGTAAAVLLAATDVRGKRPMAFLFVLSLLVAPQVAALAFKTLAGPASPILMLLGLSPPPGTPNPMVGAGGIVVVLALHHAPYVTVVLAAGLRAVPHGVVEAAVVDGASPATICRRIVLPLLRPHLVAAALLAFVAGAGNFGIPALLGVPADYFTLPTLIYRRLVSFGPTVLSDMAALSLLVAAITGLPVLAGALALKFAVTRLDAERPMAPFWRLGRARPLAEVAAWGVVLVAAVLPLASLAATALVPAYGVPLSLATVTIDNFVEVLARQDVTVRAFRNSLLFAGGAALVCAALALLVAYTLDRLVGRGREALIALIEIPYALPGVVLAITCILLFLRPLPVLGVSLYATPWIILFAYVARFLALALKPPLAAAAVLDVQQEEAAAVDGARLGQRLRHVVVPHLLPAAAAGGFLAFLLALNELTVSALLWSAGTETLGVALLSLEEAGLASEAAAVAVSGTLVVVALMLGLDAAARRLPRDVLPWRAVLPEYRTRD